MIPLGADRTRTAINVLLFAFALSFTFFSIQSGDVLMYLALARDYFLHGGWPTIDPYLYSAHTELHVAHEYLSYFTYYAAWLAAGLGGLTVLKILVLALAFGLCLWAQPRSNNSSALWMGLWILAILASCFRFIERSSLFSDLFCVLLISVLVEQRQITIRLVAGLAVLFILWIQLHPGFPLGVAILGLWALWHSFFTPGFFNRRCLWLFVPIAALFLNPLGWKGVYYPIEFALNQAPVFERFNLEWFPSYHPAFRTTPEVLGYWGLLIGALSLIWRKRTWLTLRAWLSLFAAVCGIFAVRFVPWSSFALLILLKPWSELRLPQTQKVLRWGLAALMLAVTLRNVTFGYRSSSGPRMPQVGLDKNLFPTKTLTFLREHPIEGRLYNSHDFGSYLIWEGYVPIFHHGFVTDTDFYVNDVVGVFKSQQRFLELAQKYGWTKLLVDKYMSYPYFYKILSPLPEWKIVAEDEASYLIYRLP